MRQQINLVNPALLPPKPFFQFRTMVMGLVAVALVLGGLSLLLNAGVRNYEQTAAQTAARVSASAAQLEKQAQVLALRKVDGQLVKQLDEARSQQTQLQVLASAMRSGNLIGSGPGPATYLYALASQSLPTVWLTGIELHGEHLSLQGLATQAAAIPQYLALLEKQSVFRGTRFETFELGRETAAAKGEGKQTEALAFRLESAQAGKGGKP